MSVLSYFPESHIAGAGRPVYLTEENESVAVMSRVYPSELTMTNLSIEAKNYDY